MDENRTEEERVSSASPLYSPPSSPAVYIQPGGEVQFTKEKSPGKGNWIRIVEIILSKTERQWDSETVRQWDSLGFKLIIREDRSSFCHTAKQGCNVGSFLYLHYLIML